MLTNFESSLLELSHREFRELDVVSSLEGTIESKSAQLLSLGVDKRYEEIFSEYLSLAKSGSREAMKRAAFLQFYSVLEPFAFTGLGAFAEEGVIELFDTLETELALAAVDEELARMLPYFYSLAEWFIPSRKRGGGTDTSLYPSIVDFCQTSDSPPDFIPSTIAEFENRGLMGDYFSSLNG